MPSVRLKPFILLCLGTNYHSTQYLFYPFLRVCFITVILVANTLASIIIAMPCPAFLIGGVKWPQSMSRSAELWALSIGRGTIQSMDQRCNLSIIPILFAVAKSGRLVHQSFLHEPPYAGQQ